MAFDTGITLDIYFLALTLFFYWAVDSGSQYLKINLLEIPRKIIKNIFHNKIFIWLLDIDK